MRTLADVRRAVRRRLVTPTPVDTAMRAEGMTSREEVELLHRLARQVTEGCIVEIGSYRGRSTVALGLGASEAVPVFAIDPHEPFTGVRGGIFGPEDRAAFYRAMLASGAYTAVRLVNLPSAVAATAWHLPIGLLFVDGDHSYEGARSDVELWFPHLRPGAVVAFDDTDHPGPKRVLDEECASGRVEVVERHRKITVVRAAGGA